MIHFGIVFLLSYSFVLFLTSRAFNLFNNQGHTKKVILMDEVDGMSSGDRGGIVELVVFHYFYHD